MNDVTPQETMLGKLTSWTESYWEAGSHLFGQEIHPILRFTRTDHWTLSGARWIQSHLSHPVSLRSILKLSVHLRLSLASDLFLYGFPAKTVFSISMLLTHTVHVILLDSATRILVGEDTNYEASHYAVFHPPVTSSFMGSKYSPLRPVLKYPQFTLLL